MSVPVVTVFVTCSLVGEGRHWVFSGMGGENEGGSDSFPS